MDDVAIVIDLGKIVIGADFLELLKGGELRLVIPQTDVPHGGGVLLDRGGGEVLNLGEAAFVKFVEPVSPGG